jgi:hypothetical protein
MSGHIGGLVERRDLVSRYIGEFQKRVPAQTKTQADAAAELEVGLDKGAVKVT